MIISFYSFVPSVNSFWSFTLELRKRQIFRAQNKNNFLLEKKKHMSYILLTITLTDSRSYKRTWQLPFLGIRNWLLWHSVWCLIRMDNKSWRKYTSRDQRIQWRRRGNWRGWQTARWRRRWKKETGRTASGWNYTGL